MWYFSIKSFGTHFYRWKNILVISLFPIANFTTSLLVEINFERFNCLHTFLQFWVFIFLKHDIDFKVVLKNKSLPSFVSKCGNVFLGPFPWSKRGLPSFFGYNMDFEGFYKVSWLHLKLTVLIFAWVSFQLISAWLHHFVPQLYLIFHPFEESLCMAFLVVFC